MMVVKHGYMIDSSEQCVVGVGVIHFLWHRVWFAAAQEWQGSLSTLKHTHHPSSCTLAPHVISPKVDAPDSCLHNYERPVSTFRFSPRSLHDTSHLSRICEHRHMLVRYAHLAACFATTPSLRLKQAPMIDSCLRTKGRDCSVFLSLSRCSRWRASTIFTCPLFSSPCSSYGTR